MRLRLLLAGLAGVTFLVAPTQADPLRFERECSAKVDAACHDEFCGIADCTKRDCVVYSSLLGSGNAGICVGKARPREAESK